jgi:orotidine-5'-phosphate decarboxylase
VSDPRIIVALDFSSRSGAEALVDRLDPRLCRLKVGKELFTRLGPGFVEALQARGFDVFLDLKFHDIPNTVAGACRAAAELGVWMVNVHALGGRRMLEAAREAVDKAAHPPLLVAVTLLTSMTEADWVEVGGREGVEREVALLASLARASGLNGVVCSPREVASLRASQGGGFVLVTPGIRPAAAQADDQRRTLTPAEAIAAGSDYLVVGRPVSAARDPVGILKALISEISDRD